MYTGKEIRKKFLDFMASKGHAVLPSASLVPKEDATVLFNTAGMQPLVPYLSGIESHPEGGRLASCQKCLRTNDIEEVGNNRHLSFFEMLGNWSIGDYFKAESIAWSLEFLTSPDYLNLDPNRVFVTVYQGNEQVPEDVESIEIWKREFAKHSIEAEVGQQFNFTDLSKNTANQKYRYRITKMNADENWWGLPQRGPCGSDTEIFYLSPKVDVDFFFNEVPKLSPAEAYEFIETNLVEIWNNVFMEYEGEWGEIDGQPEPVNLSPLKQKNVDTGMGLERVTAFLNGYDNIYQTDLFQPILKVIDKWAN